MGKTVVGGKPGGDGEYNARYYQATYQGPPVELGPSSYGIVTDIPYDPETEAVAGLWRDANKKVQAAALYLYTSQAGYGYSTYVNNLVSVDGKLAFSLMTSASKNKEDSVQVWCVIYSK